MTPPNASELDDIESLKRLLVAERAARFEAEAKAALATAQVSGAEAVIAHLRLAIEKMRRELYGSRSERGHKLLDQMEFELEDLEATAAEDEAAAEIAAMQAGISTLIPAHRRRSGRRPFPDHLPRERVIIPGPSSCLCCGSSHLAKLGEDITETLEVVPRQWKVIQHVREKFTCRTCEKISQAPAAVPRHRPRSCRAEPAGDDPSMPSSRCNQPLNRQSETLRARRHRPAAVDACRPCRRLRRRSRAARRSDPHPRDGGGPYPWRRPRRWRCWPRRKPSRLGYGRMFVTIARSAVPIRRPAFYAFSRDRKGEHPERHLESYAGILQADAYAGFNALYKAERRRGPITEAACWSHARRKFFVLADVTSKARSRKPIIVAPLALEAVRRCDAIFEGGACAQRFCFPDLRLAERRRSVAPLVEDLERWMRTGRSGLSRHSDVAKAMDYMLTRWPAFVRFLGRWTDLLVEQLPPSGRYGASPLGRKAWLFAGSERGR